MINNRRTNGRNTRSNNTLIYVLILLVVVGIVAGVVVYLNDTGSSPPGTTKSSSPTTTHAPKKNDNRLSNGKHIILSNNYKKNDGKASGPGHSNAKDVSSANSSGYVGYVDYGNVDTLCGIPCNDADDCVGFEYNTKSNDCWFKSNSGSPLSDNPDIVYFEKPN